MSEYINNAKVYFAYGGKPPVQTRVDILDNGWLKILDSNEYYPPDKIERVEWLRDTND